MRSTLSAVVAVLLCTSTASRAFGGASLTPLGDLPGGGFASNALGVSGDGTVIVGSGSSASGGEAFRRTAAGGMVGLGDLPGGGFGSDAYGVSGDGLTVVGNGTSASGAQAFRHTAAGGMVGLGYLGRLPEGSIEDFLSGARGVSRDGSVTVGYSTSASGYQAFRHTAAGGMVGLGYLGSTPEDFNSDAIAVSGDGSVIVGSGSIARGGEAFRYTAAGGMVGLGPGTAAIGISDDGSTIVGIGQGASVEAFRHTVAGGMVWLGHLGPDFQGNFESYAFAASGDGSTIVGYSTSPLAPMYNDAFRHTAAGGMERLWDVLLAHGVDPAADGWSGLHSANGVSLDGNTIVGYGIRNGNQEAFVAVVPEPGSLGLLGLAAPALLRRRRRV